jgi:CO/xanthine dehydrogenase Mo-binding subunit
MTTPCGHLHAVPLHAPVASAKIIRIDSSEAEMSAGVRAVFTADDIPGSVYFGQIIRDYPTLAQSRIRSTGDVLALVVAETRDQALAALPLIKLEWEALPALYDPEEALKADAILINESHGSNICNYHRVRTGDITEGEREADLVIERSFTTSRAEHVYLEPECGLAQLRPDGVMEIIGSMQHPYTRRFCGLHSGFRTKGCGGKDCSHGRRLWR